MPTTEATDRQFRLTALAGLAVLTLFVLLPPTGGGLYFGHDLYDEYYRALLEGRWQLSARVLGVEGHYLADGRGFTYYGLAPLLPRFLLGWLLPTDGTVFPKLVILFFTGAGSILLHRLVHERALAARAPVWMPPLLGAMVWLAGPAPIIGANQAVYHEPIAIGFFAFAAFLFAMHRRAQARWSPGMTLLLGGASAALALHARPHVALAICAGLAVLGIAAIVRRQRWFAGALGGVLLILASAGGYLAANQAKFGDMTAAHGDFAEDAKLRYGTAFLQYESPTSERARGFEQYGRFNARRIPTHFVAHHLLFAGAPSTQASMALVEWSGQWHGHSRFEGPHLGLLFLFAPWYMLMILGLRRDRPTVEGGAMVAAAAALFLLMLSYPTITFRYRVELFFLPFVLATISIPRAAAKLRAREKDGWRIPLLTLMLGAGLTLFASNWSRQLFQQGPLFEPMSMERCLERMELAGVTAAQGRQSCDP